MRKAGNPSIKAQRTDEADPSLPLPFYATTGAAGADLRANFPPALRTSGLILAPRARALIPTGLCIALPEEMELQIRPRSGLAYKHGVTVLNAPGTIDCDYRGEVKVLLINLGQDAFQIAHGMRIAQAVLAPVLRLGWSLCDALPQSARGHGGFGSTGVA